MHDSNENQSSTYEQNKIHQIINTTAIYDTYLHRNANVDIVYDFTLLAMSICIYIIIKFYNQLQKRFLCRT